MKIVYCVAAVLPLLLFRPVDGQLRGLLEDNGLVNSEQVSKIVACLNVICQLSIHSLDYTTNSSRTRCY